MTNIKKPITKYKLDNLRPHPRQAAYFSPMSGDDLRALADDIQRNGLRQPIEILPDGTIVCGHSRVAAVTLLEWTEIDCIVLDDLDAADAEAVERRLVEDNLNRRQLSELDIARIYRQLKQQRPGKRRNNNTGSLRDEIAKRFKVSGRTLDRWLKVLDADPSIREAVSQHRMTFGQAIEVAALPVKDQQRVAAGLDKGKKPKAPLARPASRRSATPAEPTFGRLLQELDRITDQLIQVDPPAALEAADGEVLNRCRRRLRALHQQHEARAA